MATKTKTKAPRWLLTRLVSGGSWCAHREGCEHSDAIADAVACAGLQSQLASAADLETLKQGGEFVDMQASCMLAEE